MNKPEMPPNVFYNPATGRQVSGVVKCVNCRWYQTAFRHSACCAPQLLTQVDYETGGMAYDDKLPHRPQTLREMPEHCGPQGRWFEKRAPIKTLWKLIKDFCN